MELQHFNKQYISVILMLLAEIYYVIWFVITL